MDVVHLPYTPPSIADGILRGSGCSDMKGGLAAMCEALIVLKETGILETGGILLTAHDLHETPWGDGRQLQALIREGYVGDGVLFARIYLRPGASSGSRNVPNRSGDHP